MYSADGFRFVDHPGNPLYKDREGIMEDRLAGCWGAIS